MSPHSWPPCQRPLLLSKLLPQLPWALYTQHIEPTERSLLYRTTFSTTNKRERESIGKVGSRGSSLGTASDCHCLCFLQLHRVCRGLYPGVLAYLPGFRSTFPGTPEKDLKQPMTQRNQTRNQNYFETNENENTAFQNVWDAAVTALEGNSYLYRPTSRKKKYPK